MYIYKTLISAGRITILCSVIKTARRTNLHRQALLRYSKTFDMFITQPVQYDTNIRYDIRYEYIELVLFKVVFCTVPCFNN